MTHAVDRADSGRPAPCRPDLVSALVDGELSPADQLRTRRHLAVCPVCREQYEDYQAIRARLRNEPDIDVPVAVRRKIAVRLINGQERSGTRWRLGTAATLAAGLAVIAFTAGNYFGETGSASGTVARLNSDAVAVLDRLPARRSAAVAAGGTARNATMVAATSEANSASQPAESLLAITAGDIRGPEFELSAGQPMAPAVPANGAGTSTTPEVSEPAGSAAEAPVTPAQPGLPNLLPRVPDGTNPTPTPQNLLVLINPTATATPTPNQPQTVVQAQPTSPPAEPTAVPATPTAVPPTPRPSAPSPTQSAPSPTMAPTEAATATPAEQPSVPSEPVAVVRAAATETPPPAPSATPTIEPTVPATETPTEVATAISATTPERTPAPVSVASSGESLPGNSLPSTQTAVRAASPCDAVTQPVFAAVLESDLATQAALGCPLAPADVISLQVQTFRNGWLIDPGQPYPVYALYGTRAWGALGQTTIPLILAAGAPPILGTPLGSPWFATGIVQVFEGGLALSGPEGYVFVLLDGGRARVY